MEQADVTESVVLPVGRLRAWDLLTTGGWFGDPLEIERRPGGSVTSGDRRGFVRRWEPGSMLEWEWSRSGDPGWTLVTIELEAVDAGTRVTVTETLNAWEFESYGQTESGGVGRFGLLLLGA